MKKPTTKDTAVFCTGAALLAAGLAYWFFARVASPSAPNGSDNSASRASVSATVSTLGVSASRPREPVLASPSDQTTAVPSSAVNPAITSTPQFAAAATPPPTVNVGEESAAVRMYLAHSSLREREVSDPDSATNRRILQAMVTKAISTPAGGVAAISPATD